MSTAELVVDLPRDLSVPVAHLAAEAHSILAELLGVAVGPVTIRLFQDAQAVVLRETPPEFNTANREDWQMSVGDRPGCAFCLVVRSTDPRHPFLFAAIHVDRSDDPLRFVIAAAFAIALARRARAPMLKDDLQRWIKTDLRDEADGVSALPVNDFVAQLRAPGAGGTLDEAIELFLKRANTLWAEVVSDRTP